MERDIGRLCAAVLVAVIATCGCSLQSHQISPTPNVLKQIGLPVYPHAKPMLGQITNQSIFSSGINTLAVTFETSDALSKVERFYAQRLPGDTRKTSLPIFARSVVFQLYSKTGEKQVMIFSLKDQTFIQLRAATFGATMPNSNSARPSAQ